MIHVVLDANVLVSAALAGDRAAPSVGTFDALLDERIEAVGCPALLAEVASVLRRDRLRRYTSSDEARPFVARLAAVMTLAEDPPPAVDALVTGDRDLLEPEDIGVAVITPRELVERLADAG